MEDNSGIYAEMGSDPLTCLIPTSQNAGNQIHDNDLALSARGSKAASSLFGLENEIITHDPPELDATAYDMPVLRGPDGSHVHPDNADRSDPYTVSRGGGWLSATDASSPGDAPAGPWRQA